MCHPQQHTVFTPHKNQLASITTTNDISRAEAVEDFRAARDKEWTSKQEFKDQFELTVQKHFSTSSDADITPVLEKMTLAIANGEPLKVLAQHASQHKSVMMRALI